LSVFVGKEILAIASIFSVIVHYLSPDGDVGTDGIAHCWGLTFIDFKTVPRSLACRHRTQHSRFALRIAPSHRFLACLNCSLDGNVVLCASERMARSSSSTCVHHRLALGDHRCLPNTGWREMTDGDVSHSSERRLDTGTKGIGRDLFSH
jgi:hypothetical protein